MTMADGNMLIVGGSQQVLRARVFPLLKLGYLQTSPIFPILMRQLNFQT